MNSLKKVVPMRFALSLNAVSALFLIATFAIFTTAAHAQNEKVLLLNQTNGIKSTFDQSATRSLKVIPGKDGSSNLEIQGITIQANGNRYFGIMIPLGRTWDFTKSRLEVDARTTQPANTEAFYVRAYNQGETKPCLSFNSWNNELKDQWNTFGFQEGGYASSLPFESAAVENRKPTNVDRLEFIIGSSKSGVPIDLQISNLQTAPAVISMDELAAPKKLMRTIPVVEQGAAAATILYPDDAAGKAAAMEVAQAVQQKTGVTLKMRPGTTADREFNENVILLGNVFNNPAMQLLYAREFIPVDGLCPGPGGYLLQTVHDPFGNGHGAIVVGASDDADLKMAADAFVAKVDESTFTAKVLSFDKFFEAKYSAEMLQHYSWLKLKNTKNVLQAGMKNAQDALTTGKHESIAGVLAGTALQYQLTGDSEYAKLFVAQWNLYAKSAVSDPSKFGGPWGFDSDFASYEVVSGWDNIEEDPALSDSDRLQVTKELARWLREAVAPKATMAPGHVSFNHQATPAQGILRAGLYFTENYPNSPDGKAWLAQADRVFQNQEKFYKADEDCNTYQWITIHRMFWYALARPDYTVFDNGNAAKIVDYCIATMNNLGFQVPYGDTGAWNASYGESVPMSMAAFATGNKKANWVATLKDGLYKGFYLYSYQHPTDESIPSGFDGVKVWPLEPAYVNTFPTTPRPPDDQLFDKLTFRQAIDKETPYILLDGLGNGGHGHRDGNSLEQLTQFNRIWLADNDYYKAQAKYQNTMLILHNGEASEIPPYVALLGHGETDNFGYSHTQISDYSDADWDRYVVWLKKENAFVVLDKVTAREEGEYQCDLLWHGVGDAKLTDEGMLLSQKGPSMFFQIGKGPQLNLVNDTDLGANWKSYPDANPVVRSLNATSRVHLMKGQHYLFATVFHGNANGDVQPWKVNFEKGYNGVQLVNGQETLDVQLANNTVQLQQTSNVTTFDEPQTVDASKSTFDANAKPTQIALAPPIENLSMQYQAPQFRTSWDINPAPTDALLTGNLGQPGAVKTPAALSSDPVPQPDGNVLVGGSNNIDDLLKDAPVMFPVGKTVKLIIDLHQSAPLSKVQWQEWWASTSSKGTSYLLDHATVEISNDNFVKDIRNLGAVQGGSHLDWGAPVNYDIDAAGQSARYVRLTLIPKPGSAIYLANIAVTGPVGDANTNSVPYQFTKVIAAQLQKGAPKVLLASTAQGTLLAISSQGKVLWSKDFNTQLNDVAAGDANGDGIDEIAVARQDGKVTLLDNTGKVLWETPLQLYREAPYVNLIRMADLDGDGKDEVVVGAQNWRFYVFNSEGKELWQYEVVHASTAGAVADLNGDGKKEVIAGTHYYDASVLNYDGKLLWRQGFKAPICYDIATGNFDGNKTRGVVFGSGDGNIYYTDSAGKTRMTFNTGDEVKHVATADLDGDGIDEILATSDNGYLYCFGADGKLHWLHQLGNAATALTTMVIDGHETAIAGTSGGDIFAFDASGKLVRKSTLGSAVTQLATDGNNLIAASVDGHLMELTP